MDAPESLNIPSHLIADDYIRLACRVNGFGEVPRFVLPVPLSLLDDPSTSVLLQREFHGDGYDRMERSLLDHYLKAGDLFLDVGAHWGLYSLHAVTSADNIKAIAIEPDPENLRHLRYAVAQNQLASKIEIVAGAAASSVGQVWLRPNTAMGHHTYKSQEKAGPAAFEVKGVSVDEVLAGYESVPVWLKIDVEGREYGVLEGASRLLASGRLQGVFWESQVAETLPNPDLAKILDLLEAHRFTTFEINPTNRISLAGHLNPPDFPQVKHSGAG